MVCSRVEYHTQRFLNHADIITSGKLGEVQTNAESKWEILSKQGSVKCRQFRQYVDEIDLSDICQSLRDHFRKPQIRIFLTTWTEPECPQAGDKYEVIETQAKQYVRARFSKIIEEWEDETHMFEERRRTIGREVSRLLKELDADVAAITRVLTPVRPPELKPPGFQFSLKMNRTIFGSLQQWFSDMFDITNNTRKAQFMQNPLRSMEEMAQTTLQYLMMDSNIQRLVKKSMGLPIVVATFKSQVESEVRNAKAEVADLRRRETAEQFRKGYKPIQTECLDIHTNLLQWELEYLFEGDLINSDDVKLCESKYILGSGSATGYYRGMQKVEDAQKAVTVKRYAVRDKLRAILGDYKFLK